jgi:TonB-linked SusC/RagA family outer membrane protein
MVKSNYFKLNRARALTMLILCVCFLFGGQLAQADNLQQKFKISGNVVDTNGEAIIGANVLVKGTNVGTITDINGHFTLSASSESVLKVSCMGYLAKEIKVVSDSPLSITLKEDSKTLEEVVVVGFGTQKKVNLTGSVGTVDSKELSSRPVVNATQALQGLVPGLQITQTSGSLGDTPSINVRGTATIGKGSTGNPLILIDGMEGDINSINPQDIENISVLKDAAASSIYGSRAPFGVILVTTKNGKSGKTIVNYNNNFRVSSAVNMPEMMDSYTFATYFNDAYANANWGTFFSADRMQRIKDYRDGKLKDSVTKNGQYWSDGYGDGNDNVDWYKALYKSSTFSQEHNISANGGTEKLNYYASANYLGQDGLMKLGNEGYKRYTTTAKMNTQLNDWAKFNYSIRFTRTDYERPSSLTDGLYSDLARQGWPVLPLYDPNGYLYSSPSPALGLATGGTDATQTDNTYQQASLILEPVKNWITHVDVNYRIKSANRHWDSHTTYNHDVDGNPVIYNKGSNVHEDYLKENYLNLNIFSEYSFKLNENHNFKVMGGFQSEELKKKVFGLQRDGIIVDGFPEVDLTSGTAYDGKAVTPSVNGASDSWSTAGFFGRLNYDYKGRYLAEVNVRYDGTSRFRPEQRWNVFPSVSLGWNIARESFWEPMQDKISTLKLRASYGELGNQNTDNWYPTYQKIDYKSNDTKNGTWLQNGVLTNTALVPALISSTLGWERVKTWNAGLDFAAFNNRLTGSFDTYVRKTLNMVGPAPELPDVLGIGVPQTNNTDLKTYGWELQLGWRDRLNNGLNYSVNFTLADARTEITRYPNFTGSLDSKMYYSKQMMGEIWGYETIGIAKTNEEMNAHLAKLTNGGQSSLGNSWGAGDIMYKDLNGDGKIDNGAYTTGDHGDLKVIGNNTPRYQFGLDLSADWKGFDVRCFFQGVAKRDYWQGSYYFWGATSNMWWSSGLKQHVDYFRAEASNDLPANIDAYYPRPIFGTGKNQETQTRYLQDASYIRLKNLQLGYSLPNNIVSKLNITKLRLFVSGENLWTGTSLAKMFDPETIDGGKDHNGNAYPLQRTISFGLSLTL